MARKGVFADMAEPELVNPHKLGALTLLCAGLLGLGWKRRAGKDKTGHWVIVVSLSSQNVRH